MKIQARASHVIWQALAFIMVMIFMASFASAENASFVFEINATVENMTVYGNMTTLLGNESILSAVELDIYADTLSENFTICTYYVNGTDNFSCFTNISAERYLLVGITEYANSTYHRNLTLNITANATEPELNLSEDNVSVTLIDSKITEKDGITTEEKFNFTVRFREAYEGRHIYGEIGMQENNSDIYETVEMDIAPIDEPSNITMCHYAVNGSRLFNCSLTRLKTGIYNITAFTEHNQKLYSVNELTYLRVPEFNLNINVEGNYTIGEVIQIIADTWLGEELLDFINISIEITDPENVTTLFSDIQPDFSFIPQLPGEYRIRAVAYLFGIRIEAEVVVSIGEPRVDIIEESYLELRTDIDEIYESGKAMNFSITLLNISSITVENTTNRTESASDTSMFNVSILVKDPDSVLYELVPIAMNSSYLVEFYPVAAGNYSANISTLNMTLLRHFTVLNRTKYVEEKYILPAIENATKAVVVVNKTVNRTNVTQLVNISRIMIVEENDTLDVGLEFNDSSVFLDNVSNIEDIAFVQMAKSDILSTASDVIAIDGMNKSLKMASVRIALRKSQSDVGRIMYCEMWNYTGMRCPDWKLTDIGYGQNSSHVYFNVSHFTAYAGGGASNSQLEIYDTSDKDKQNITVFINESFEVIANFSETATNQPILNAMCNVSVEKLGFRTLFYINPFYRRLFNNLNMPPGLYSYNISCYEDSYDQWNATDNITIYSYANLTDLKVKNVTVGTKSFISVRVVDHFNNTNISGYNVTFYSNKDGYIGWSLSNSSGIAVINFTPSSLGTHMIRANITNQSNIYYYHKKFMITRFMNADPSMLKIRKQVNRTYNLTYNISLMVENTGKQNLFNITASDFLPNYFSSSNYSISPTWNVSSDHYSGDFLLWNITHISPGETKYYDYMITYNGTLKIRAAELYRIGITMK